MVYIKPLFSTAPHKFFVTKALNVGFARFNLRRNGSPAMKKLAVIGGILALVVLLSVWLSSSLMQDGPAAVQFRFHVIESPSNRSVKDAKIRVIHYSQLRDLSDTNLAGTFPAKGTDADGLATVSVLCSAHWSSYLFVRAGRFNISHELFIEANGYRPLSTALANVVGGRRWPTSKRVFDVELVLFKNP